MRIDGPFDRCRASPHQVLLPDIPQKYAHRALTLTASADRCRRYAESKTKGLKEYPPPTRYVPRRYASAEELKSITLESANTFDLKAQANANGNRKYTETNNYGIQKITQPTRNAPRRYVSVGNLLCFAPDPQTDRGFEIKISFQDLDTDSSNQSVSPENQPDPLALKAGVVQF